MNPLLLDFIPEVYRYQRANVTVRGKLTPDQFKEVQRRIGLLEEEYEGHYADANTYHLDPPLSSLEDLLAYLRENNVPHEVGCRWAWTGQQ